MQAQEAFLQISLLWLCGVLTGFQTCPPQCADGFSLQGELQRRCFVVFGKSCGEGWLLGEYGELGLIQPKGKEGFDCEGESIALVNFII